jgi:phospholipid N-methyltransferase
MAAKETLLTEIIYGYSVCWQTPKQENDLQAGGFLKNFIRHPIETGAVAASSSGLADAITEAANLDDARVVVEFGSGTGVFTEAIARKLPERATFFALEINPAFVEATRSRCPGVDVIHDSAVETKAHLRRRGLDYCDRVVCGLPWASFSETRQADLLETIVQVLRPGGVFVTFAYVQGLLMPAGWRFRKNLKSTFPRVTTTRTVWRNVPPAFVDRAEM